MASDGRIEYGNHWFSYWEDDTVVVTTHRFHAGKELVIEERIRLLNDGASLAYSHSVTGPDRMTNNRETTLRV